MNICAIKENDIANGPGIRLSVFVSGCMNHCPGCFQPDTWDFNAGKPCTDETIDYIINELSDKKYAGITFLGGDPMEFVNQEGITPIIKRIRSELPGKTIWIYTGYIYDKHLMSNDLINGIRHCDSTDYILNNIDVLVDGPFIQDLYDISLPFKGSRNQRVIDMIATRDSNSIILSKYN